MDRALGQSVQPQSEVAGVFQTFDVPATIESADPQARQVLPRLADDTLVTLQVKPQARYLRDAIEVIHVESVAIDLAPRQL